MSPASATDLTLLRLMSEAPRGPRREGAFALWLTVRVIEDLTLVPPPSERAVRRRVALLERRLSSLTLIPALRRGLATALSDLQRSEPVDPAVVLQRLMSPAEDGVGVEARDAIQRLAKALRN